MTEIVVPRIHGADKFFSKRRQKQSVAGFKEKESKTDLIGTLSQGKDLSSITTIWKTLEGLR